MGQEQTEDIAGTNARRIRSRDIPIDEWEVERSSIEFVRQRYRTKDAVFKLQGETEAFALRLYSPQKELDAVLYEHKVMEEYNNIIPLAKPILTKTGETLAEDNRGRYWSLSPWIKGVHPENEDREVIGRCASILARIHKGPVITPPEGYVTSVAGEIGKACPGMGLEQALNVLNSYIKPRHTHLLDKFTSSDFTLDEPTVQIHGDFQNMNIIFGKRTETVIDWERSRPGEASYDVAWGAFHISKLPKYRNLFIETYAEEMDISVDDLRYSTQESIKARLIRSILNKADHLNCNPKNQNAINHILRYVAKLENLEDGKEIWVQDF